MAELLAVVLGAGASKDCVAEGSISDVDPNFKPPLAAELFEARVEFNRILSKYTKANALSESIRVRIRNNENLEDILKDLMSKSDLQWKKQVWAVAFYLQEVLWTVTDRFVRSGGTKYDTLVPTLVTSRFDQILFLTLNYDLFLERAVAVFDDVPFRSLDEYYLESKKWSLIKVHGSVNWGRRLSNGRSDSQNVDVVLSSLDKEPHFSSDI